MPEGEAVTRHHRVEVVHESLLVAGHGLCDGRPRTPRARCSGTSFGRRPCCGTQRAARRRAVERLVLPGVPDLAGALPGRLDRHRGGLCGRHDGAGDPAAGGDGGLVAASVVLAAVAVAAVTTVFGAEVSRRPAAPRPANCSPSVASSSTTTPPRRWPTPWPASSWPIASTARRFRPGGAVAGADPDPARRVQARVVGRLQPGRQMARRGQGEGRDRAVVSARAESPGCLRVTWDGSLGCPSAPTPMCCSRWAKGTTGPRVVGGHRRSHPTAWISMGPPVSVSAPIGARSSPSPEMASSGRSGRWPLDGGQPRIFGRRDLGAVVAKKRHRIDVDPTGSLAGVRRWADPSRCSP